MKFKIYRTSNEEGQAIPEAVLDEETHVVRRLDCEGFHWNESSEYLVEINTLEELLDLCRRVHQPLILYTWKEGWLEKESPVTDWKDNRYHRLPPGSESLEIEIYDYWKE